MSKRSKDLDKDFAVALAEVTFVALAMVKTVVDATVAGIPSEKALRTFVEKQFPLISAALTSAGMAGGAYLGATIWVSNLGFWSSIGYSLGFVSMPLWAPVAGALAGVVAVGGGLFGLSRFLQSGRARKSIVAIYGISKKLLGQGDLTKKEDEFVKVIVSQLGLKGDEITQEMKSATYEEARQTANEIFDTSQKVSFLKSVFPIVFTEDGIFSSLEKDNFSIVAKDLNLSPEIVSEIEDEIGNSWNKSWDQYENIAKCANSILSFSSIDHSHFDESLNSSMEKLLAFDPRAEAAQKRKNVLNLVSTAATVAGVFIATNPFIDAAIVGAYALLRSASDNENEEQEIERALEKFIASHAKEIGSRKGTIMDQKATIDQTLKKTKKKKAA